MTTPDPSITLSTHMAVDVREALARIQARTGESIRAILERLILAEDAAGAARAARAAAGDAEWSALAAAWAAARD